MVTLLSSFLSSATVLARPSTKFARHSAWSLVPWLPPYTYNPLLPPIFSFLLQSISQTPTPKSGRFLHSPRLKTLHSSMAKPLIACPFPHCWLSPVSPLPSVCEACMFATCYFEHLLSRCLTCPATSFHLSLVAAPNSAALIWWRHPSSRTPLLQAPGTFSATLCSPI